MLSVNPTLTPAQVIEHIRASARPFPTTSDTEPAPPACVSPTVTPVQNAECICTTAYCGAGMLDTHAAVLAAQAAPQNPDPPGDGGGGGGGGAGLGSLLALFGLWLTRRRGLT
jgi:serine protease